MFWLIASLSGALLIMAFLVAFFAGCLHDREADPVKRDEHEIEKGGWV